MSSYVPPGGAAMARRFRPPVARPIPRPRPNQRPVAPIPATPAPQPPAAAASPIPNPSTPVSTPPQWGTIQDGRWDQDLGDSFNAIARQTPMPGTEPQVMTGPPTTTTPMPSPTQPPTTTTPMQPPPTTQQPPPTTTQPIPPMEQKKPTGPGALMQSTGQQIRDMTYDQMAASGNMWVPDPATTDPRQALLSLPPNLRQAVLSKKMSLGAALGRHAARKAGTLPGQQNDMPG